MRLPKHNGARVAASGIAAALLVTMGCAGPNHFTNPKADLSTMHKVAVVPFENMSAERLSGEKVQRLFLAELLNSNAFEVIEPGRVVRTLKDERIESPAAMTPEEIQRVGKVLKADGIFFGTVLDFADTKATAGGGAAITVQFKLVETGAGTTVWSASRHRSGTSLGAKMFGLSPTNSTVIATELVRDALHTLVR
jgi:polysaccharide biosynthesis protein PelC